MQHSLKRGDQTCGKSGDFWSAKSGPWSNLQFDLSQFQRPELLYGRPMHRRRRPSRKWLILALLAMIWSQSVLALHGGCASLPPSHARHGAATVNVAGHQCDESARETQDPTCLAHCDHKSSTTDVSRIPPVPAMLPLAWGVVHAVNADAAPMLYARGDAPPRSSLHGPLGHPTPLLLI